MGRLSERLAGHVAVGLDTSVFIYHLEAHPRYLPLTQEVLAYGLPFQASSQRKRVLRRRRFLVY